MKQNFMQRWFVLPVIFLLPLVVTVCGGGSSSTTYTLSGRITASDGTGLSGVTVNATGFGQGGCTSATRTATTDANGYYAFTETNPPSGQVAITPYKQGYTFLPSSITVMFNYADISGQNFTATPVPHSISGRVVGTNGAGIGAITVTLSGASSATATTDADGNYAFAGLLHGSYTLAPLMAAPGYTFTPQSRTVNIDYADVPGQNFTVTTYVISGRATTTSGIGFSGVNIALSGTASASAVTDADGYYTLTVLQTGPYIITPSMSVPGYTFTPANRSVTITSGDVSGQDFSTVAYAVSGRVATPGGIGVSGITVSVVGPVSLSSLSNANGDYAVAVVQSGTYTITPSDTCSAYSFTPAGITTTVAAADVTGQNFTAAAIPHSISGRVFAPDGTGAPGVTVNLTGTASQSATTNADGDYAFVVTQSGSYTITPSTTDPDYAFSPGARSFTLCGADVTGQNFAETAAWGKLYGPGSLYSIQTTSDNGFIAAGSVYGALQVFKLSANGGILWQKSYGVGEARSVRETADGGYVATGSTTTFGVGGIDLWVLKLDANGAILWQKAYGNSYSDQGNSIFQTADGGYVTAGTYQSSAGIDEMWVLRLDASGTVKWRKSYGTGWVNSVQQTSDGGYIAAGSHILKLDANGNRVWQKSYSGTANSIKQTSDGGYIAAGYTFSFGAGGKDFWVLRLDADGSVLWQKAYGETFDEIAQSVLPTSDGGYIVAGYVTTDPNTEFVSMLKLDSSGNISWQKRYGGWPLRYRAYSLDITADNRYIVAGTGSYFGTFALVLKIDSNGDGCKMYDSNVATTATTASPFDSSDPVIDTAAVETITTAVPVNTSATASQECPL